MLPDTIAAWLAWAAAAAAVVVGPRGVVRLVQEMSLGVSTIDLLGRHRRCGRRAPIPPAAAAAQ